MRFLHTLPKILLMLFGALGCVAPVERARVPLRALRIGAETPYEVLDRLGKIDLERVPGIEIGLKWGGHDVDLKSMALGIGRLESYLASLGFKALPRREDGNGTPSAVWGFVELRFSRVPLVRTEFATRVELVHAASLLWSRGLLYGVEASDGWELVQPEESIVEACFDPGNELRVCALTGPELQAMNERISSLADEPNPVPIIRVLVLDVESLFWGFRLYDFGGGWGLHDTIFSDDEPGPHVATAFLNLEWCADRLGKREAALLAVRLWEVGVVTGLEFGMGCGLVTSASNLETVASLLGDLPWLQLEDGMYQPPLEPAATQD